MNEHLLIFAQITPKPECLGFAKEAIEGIIPQTLSEPGCLQFALHKDESGCLYLYEEWRDEHALQQHYAMDYTKAVFKSYQS